MSHFTFKSALRAVMHGGVSFMRRHPKIGHFAILMVEPFPWAKVLLFRLARQLIYQQGRRQYSTPGLADMTPRARHIHACLCADLKNDREG